MNMSVFKSIPMAGGRRAEFRIETFNLFNWVNYGFPAANISNLGTFGRIFRDITGENPGQLRAREKAASHGFDSVPACFLIAAHRPNLTRAVSEKRRRERKVKNRTTK